MGIADTLVSKIAKDNSGSFAVVRKNVSNWHSLPLLLTGVKKSFVFKLRNGETHRASIGENSVRLEYGKHELFFYYSTKEELIHTILMIIGEFFGDQHYELNVGRKDVVDIGAYFGDTAIYFVLKGARRVYAFEPYPYSYGIAKKNVEINKLENKIIVVNAGAGGKDSVLKVSSKKSSAGSEIKSEIGGKKVDVYSLDTIVKKFKLKKAAMKIDCEGCEYNIILNASEKALRSFTDILIEYHYGHAQLIKKLENAGFNVKHILDEGNTKNINVKNKDMTQGIILAKR